MPLLFCSMPKTTDPRPKGTKMLGSSSKILYKGWEKSEIIFNTLQIHVDFLSLKKILSKDCARQKLDRTSNLAKFQKLLGLLNFSSESCTDWQSYQKS